MSKLHSNRVELGTITTTQRDALSSPPAGTIIFNSTDGTPQIYDGSSWKNLTNPFSSFLEELKPLLDQKVHTFTSSGNFVVNQDTNSVRVLILMEVDLVVEEVVMMDQVVVVLVHLDLLLHIM